MTTEIKISVEGNLFGSRRSQMVGDAERLVAIRFEARAVGGESRAALRRRCFEDALDRLCRAQPTTAIWLLACHSAWQPKTRILIHRGLWKSLESSGLVLPSGGRSAERQVESESGVRYFGAVGVPLGDLDRAYGVLEAEPASLLVASIRGNTPALDDDLVAHWLHLRHLDLLSWLGVAERVCRREEVLFRPFGYFDDVEVGTDLILERPSLGEVLDTIV